MSRITVVVGGQAGSEGKGAVCAHLLKSGSYSVNVRVGGPNAGHSVVDETGRKWAFRHLPVGAVLRKDIDLVIAAGSEVDFDVLNKEVIETNNAGWDVSSRLWVDERATVITAGAKAMEVGIESGTTGKGIGGARALRSLRKAPLVKDYDQVSPMKWMEQDTQEFFTQGGSDHENILLEGTQGYILGSHAGEYPYSTSGNCRAIDFMAMCGMPPQEVDTWVVLRMNPIRIAGNSGPLAKEIQWSDLGVEPELTTVTQKIRRVGEWDMNWAQRSVWANAGKGGVKIALTFVDYTWPTLGGDSRTVMKKDLPSDVVWFIDDLEDSLNGMGKVRFLGTGPSTGMDLVG